MSEATDEATSDWQTLGLRGRGRLIDGSYEWYDGIPVGAVIGRNVRRLREERSLTQHELAQLWKRHGLGWARSKVSALEAGRRPQVAVADLLLMAASLQVPLAELFDGPGKVELVPEPSPVEVSASALRAFVAGESINLALAVDDPRPTQADSELAARLGVHPQKVVTAAMHLFGDLTLTQERDRRVDGLGAKTMPERQAHRGHITRELSVQIEEQLKQEKDGAQ